MRDYVERQRQAEMKKAAEAAAASTAAAAAETRAQQHAESGLPPMDKAQRRRSTANMSAALHRNRSMAVKSSAELGAEGEEDRGGDASQAETHYPGQGSGQGSAQGSAQGSSRTSNASSEASSPKQQPAEDAAHSATDSNNIPVSEESNVSPTVKRTRILQRRKSCLM